MREAKQKRHRVNRGSVTADFAAKAQAHAATLVDPNPIQRLSSLCEVIEDIPLPRNKQEYAVTAMILRRLAAAFFCARDVRQVPPAARARRPYGDVHVARALDYIQR